MLNSDLAHLADGRAVVVALDADVATTPIVVLSGAGDRLDSRR